MGGLRVEDAKVVLGGRPIIEGVSLEVAPGEVLGLLGPSGCGKSTLLRAIIGLEPLAAGVVAYDGQDLARVPVHRRGFGLLFQEGQLFAHRNVARNVAYGLESAPATGRLPRPERAARVAALLELVDLAGFERRSVATLSGGEKQRVAPAARVIFRPPALLLGEPTSNVDAKSALAIQKAVAKAVAAGSTVVAASHDHAWLETLGARTLRLE
ncbi:MAG: ATP-binding cassette domain-containing protein [Promicromonosporaceae bacterium]|nr:ATP-binding cassette domain-containing protein [Promicromonosporaceae bacterium]